MSLIVDRRDQEFVLYEMLGLEELFSTPRFADYSKDMFDMAIDLSKRISEEEVLTSYMEGDREGAKLINGEVKVPHCYHHLHKIMNDSGLFTMAVSPEAGGQGFPYVIDLAAREYYVFNMGFLLYPEAAVGAAHLIEVYGTEEQKNKYMYKMYEGKWGGTMVLTEPEAGSDVGNLKTKAIPQPDGTYRIVGSKIFISGGDSDLFENIVHPVLARIEGDPSGTAGISIFLVPKYMVNDDGTIGERNDVTITGIEHKMGLKGSATCSMSFGDNGNCYAELLGKPRQGMKIMFQMMNEARIGMGLQGLGTASIAYLHALNYAKERKQGADLMNMQNPEAPRVSIINHPDVRRMLIWMKSHVEGMRALVYLCALAIDRKEASEGDEAEKWHGIMELLVPITKAYCTDMGFRVTELAIQIYGGYGYCQDYPVEQFMRDLKIGSIYEGTNGIQALDLVGRKMAQKKGANFINFLGEINKTLTRYKDNPRLTDISKDIHDAVNILADMGMFFVQCGKEGKFLIPISNAYSFLNLMGTVTLGWLLFWQSGIAYDKLDAIGKENHVDVNDANALAQLAKEHKEAAFYCGKIHSARYYIAHVLPHAQSYAKAIKSQDISMLNIPEESFAIV
ncbi:MAG TPA: acyl-CoA dehydrogenase [Spirochaetota bacterium]|nr:acyl-CoA dehydrogenase [Spirochaetota bacterium]HQL44374.1 acyl-CoA dehydrogenase [Spirochaetota bacterium]